jgi:hypothetical protein
MVAKGFYYFLLAGELAILGLLLAGIYSKAKKILEMYGLPANDQILKHDVSESEHAPEVPAGITGRRHAGGMFFQTPGAEPGQDPAVSRH